MDFLAPVIIWFNTLVGNFGVTIVISVVLLYLITIPFKILSYKNQKAKESCKQAVMFIRQRYNAGKMGVNHSNTPDMPKEIQKMSYEEREDAMANEIETLYKKHGYHMWTGWIPTILSIIFIIMIYAGIRAASPDGFWRLNLHTMNINGNLSDRQNCMVMLAGMICSSLLSPLFSASISIYEAKMNHESIKPSLIALGISLILTIGFSMWIAWRVTMAISLAITTLYVLSFSEFVIKKISAAPRTFT